MSLVGDRYDWTTGAPDNGNDWRKFCVVPRSYPLRSLVLCFGFVGVDAEGLLDYQEWAGIISIVRWNLRPVIFGVDLALVQPQGCTGASLSVAV